MRKLCILAVLVTLLLVGCTNVKNDNTSPVPTGFDVEYALMHPNLVDVGSVKVNINNTLVNIYINVYEDCYYVVTPNFDFYVNTLRNCIYTKDATNFIEQPINNGSVVINNQSLDLSNYVDYCLSIISDINSITDVGYDGKAVYNGTEFESIYLNVNGERYGRFFYTNSCKPFAFEKEDGLKVEFTYDYIEFPHEVQLDVIN